MPLMLYLASQSPRRHQLIRQLKRPFTIVRSTYQERITKKDPPEINAMRNAIGKAEKAKISSRKKGIIIGADTFLFFQDQIIGKPRNLKDAHRILKRLSGRIHWVYTGLCLKHIETSAFRVSYEKTKVKFNRLNDETIHFLFKRFNPLDKAGAYAIQEDQRLLIDRIEGSKTNVIGLPMEKLRRELKQMERLLC